MERKTRKKLIKPMKKLIRKHGREVAIELVMALIATISAGTDDKTPKKLKKKLKRAENTTTAISGIAAPVVTNFVAEVIPDVIRKRRTKRHPHDAGANTGSGDQDTTQL
jgi:hypothetical protein